MESQRHVIFGAGQIGAQLAVSLHAQGHRVRVVRRSNKAVAPGIEVVGADATDKAQAVAAAEGADVVYHCMNPSAYSGEAWQQEFPAMGEAVIAAALQSDARLVCLDNLYHYGETDSARTEETAMRAAGAKGQVRVQWDARLREAARLQGLRWTAGRAGDFFGPGTGDQSFISMAVVEGLGKGRPALLIADPRQPHAFSWAPDVVAGLQALGAADADIEGRAWHLPVHTVAPRDLVKRLAQAQGHRGWAIVLPKWVLRGLAPVVSLFGMLLETLYQWDRPFLVDDSAFKARFPGVGATLEDAVAQTVAAIDGTETPTPLPTAAPVAS